MVAGAGFEPHDLRVMSPMSYQAALPRDEALSCRPVCIGFLMLVYDTSYICVCQGFLPNKWANFAQKLLFCVENFVFYPIKMCCMQVNNCQIAPQDKLKKVMGKHTCAQNGATNTGICSRQSAFLRNSKPPKKPKKCVKFFRKNCCNFVDKVKHLWYNK